MKILELVNKESYSANDVLSIIDEIGRNKDIIIVKHDGIRDVDPYSAIVITSKSPSNSFRCDSSSLEGALRNVLNQYINHLGNK